MRRYETLQRRCAPFLLFGPLAVGCGTTDHHRSCTVSQNADGSATISCDDGTSAVVSPGENGAPGQPGISGDEGRPGISGEPGEDGSSCSITTSEDGRPVVTCTDGTSAELPDEHSGIGGAGGAGGSRSVFYSASSFTVAFPDSEDPVSFSSTGDYAYIPDGDAPFFNFLLLPVRLPDGAEVLSMTCRFYDNTSLADLEADAALMEKVLDSESGVERIRFSMGERDEVLSAVQSATATPTVPLVLNNDEYSYFIRIYWLTGNTGSSAVRFYGCGLEYQY